MQIANNLKKYLMMTYAQRLVVRIGCKGFDYLHPISLYLELKSFVVVMVFLVF